MVSATGLGSGIDINGLVTQLVNAERANSDLQLSRATTKANTKLSALGNLKGAISSFQSSLGALENLSSFDKKSASSTDATTVAAVARAAAVPNTYAVEVTQLAAAHSLASRSFAATDTAIGTGTLTFRFGTTTYNANTDVYSGFSLNADSKVTTLTIDSSNNTLEGIMAAINDADFGVRAAIVQAGDGYKLLLSSDSTGSENSLEITVSDGDSNNTNTGATAGLSNFAFNSAATNMEQTAAARDANFKINGLALTSSTNTAKEVMAGVDLTFSKLSTEAETITIKKDNSTAIAAMQSFVAGYNSLAKTVNSLSGYDAVKKQGGPLMGDATLRSIMSQADAILRKEVEGLTGNYTTLAAIGLKTGLDKQYSLDVTRFTEVLSTVPDKLPALFSAYGKPTDADISYKSASELTKVGSYAVTVSQLATAGTYNGDSVLPDFTPGNYLTLDADNSTFTIEVDGVSSGSLSLTLGEYQSGASLAEEIEARINGASTLVEAGVTVAVSYDADNNRFAIVSDSVGSTSTVKITAAGTNVPSALGLLVQNGTAGLNVAGTIGGVAATGAGAVLTAASTSDAKGLKLTIGGTATGSRGTVAFTRGINNQLDLLFDKVLASTGGLATRIKSYNTQLQTITDKKADQELRWAAVKARYSHQFNALDSLVSKLNSTGSFLSQQLANLPGVGGGD